MTACRNWSRCWCLPAIGCWHRRCNRSLDIAFDGERLVGLIDGIGGNGYVFRKVSNAVGVILDGDFAALAWGNGFGWAGWDRASARTLAEGDHEVLCSPVPNDEIARSIALMRKCTEIDGFVFNFDDWAVHWGANIHPLGHHGCGAESKYGKCDCEDIFHVVHAEYDRLD